MSEEEKGTLELAENGKLNDLKGQENSDLKQKNEVYEVASNSSEAFEAVLRQVGDNGPWQWRLLVIVSYCGIFTCFHNLSAVFLAATPEHWCRVPGLQELNTTEDLRNISIPWVDDGAGGGKYSSCSYYDRDWSTLVASGALDGNTLPDLSTNLTKECDHWFYDHSVYKSTVVEEWDLVCRDKYLMSMVQSTSMGGMLTGALILSELSDMFGRRTTSLLSTVGFLITAVCVTFSTNYTSFISLRFLVAAFGSGIFLPNFVILMEVVGPKGRTLMGMLYQSFYSVGILLLAAIGYFVRDWRYLQLCISVPVVLLLLYYWILPESPRWLMMKGRYQEGLKILAQAAKFNGGSLPQQHQIDVLVARIDKERCQATATQGNVWQRFLNFFKNIISLLRTRNMRRRCFIMFFEWFVISMVYFGLLFSGGNINASVYILTILSGVVEIPSYIFVSWTIQKLGRRVNLCGVCVISGVALLLILTVPKELVWLNIILTTVGRFFNSAAFALVFIYSTELVPTGVRNVALGTSSVCARLGSAIAPFIVDLLGEVHYAVPSTVFGLLSLAAGLLALLLPETGKTRLPETVEEVEAMPR
ncbi:organic cation transporter protein-like [Panulirus ornatus]|uniref:organic cation transporter protein-like n=1 Tax=Panulirus ornatus TaxID=150431 RepID=UPI003A87CA3F